MDRRAEFRKRYLQAQCSLANNLQILVQAQEDLEALVMGIVEDYQQLNQLVNQFIIEEGEQDEITPK
jgi:hypothetical protein